MIDTEQLHSTALGAFPNLIADYQRQILALEQRLRPLQSELDRKKLEIERIIADDPELTNEIKRKVVRQELMLAPEFLANAKLVQDSEDEIRHKKIDLEQIQNTFAVFKVYTKIAILEKETKDSHVQDQN